MRKRQKYWFHKPYKKSWLDDVTGNYGGSILNWLNGRHPVLSQALMGIVGGLIISSLIFFAKLG